MRCAALYHNGRRCSRKIGLRLVTFHGEGEIYSHPCEISWVVVPMCPAHQGETGSKLYSERAMIREEKRRQKVLTEASKRVDRQKNCRGSKIALDLMLA